MKRRFLVVTGVLLVGAAVLWAYRVWRSPEDLVLSGTIEARDVQVGSLVGGRVTSVLVDEGARVKAHQKLVTLEPDLLDLQIREQKAKVEQARAQLQLKLAGPRPEEIARARTDWENAETERQRFKVLLETGVVARQKYDESATTARMKHEMILELEQGSRKEDIDAARATLAQEESHLSYLYRQRKETVVIAPADGVIQSLDLRPGDLVTANQPVLTLLERNQLWVRVYVPETRLGLVRLGQRADLTVDTFPGRTFPGKVVEIREQGEYTPRNIQTVDERSDYVFGVKVEVAPTPELKPGMAALVSLKP